MEWTFNDDGMINPLCFIDIKRIEQLFKSPNRYLYYLVKKLEGKINLALDQEIKPYVPDKDLREIAGRLAEEMFGSRDVRTLSVKSRLTLARNLKQEFAASPKQISRMLHLEASILKDFIKPLSEKTQTYVN